MRNLQAALRHGLDQACGLQAGNHLAHRAQRHIQQCHQLTLRNELTTANATAEDLLGEAVIGTGTLAAALD
jgi:hypothetical protein